jgi:hypothetical protein
MIGKLLKLITKAALTGLCLSPCLAASASNPVVCSAFDDRGDSATVTLTEQKLALEISRASGDPLLLSTSVNERGLLGCKVFFDKDSHYVAVGLNHLGLTPGPLRIVVTDLTTSKSVGDFEVPNAGLGASLNLVGFLRNKPTLLVLGSAAADHPVDAFSTALFRVTGEQENPPETRTLPADAGSIGNPSFADAAHNRLWFKGTPQFCPMRSVRLVGEGPDEAVVDEPEAKAACDVADAIAYPNENTVITAVTRQPKDLVTRVDLGEHKVAQIELPSPRGYTSIGRAVLSPDAEVFAVTRNLLSNDSLLGGARSRGTEVDILQVSPLKIIGKLLLRAEPHPASVSIDHRNGVVTVLSFQNGTWKSQTMIQ